MAEGYEVDFGNIWNGFLILWNLCREGGIRAIRGSRWLRQSEMLPSEEEGSGRRNPFILLRREE